MAKVTFTKNIDHYVVGDVRELDKDEIKRLEAYAKRWDVEAPYFEKGEKDIVNEEAAQPDEKKTLGGQTVTEGDTPAETPEQPSDPKTKAKAEDTTVPVDVQEGDLEVEDEDEPEDDGQDDDEEAPAGETVEGADTGEEQGDTPEVQGQGDTPADATNTETKPVEPTNKK